MRRHLLLTAFLILFLCSCTSKMDLHKAHIGVIHTNSLKEDSEFVVLNNDGQVVNQHRINEMGIFQIAHGKDKGYILPVMFGHRMVHISADGTISKEDVIDYPLYTKEGDHIRVTTYNTHLNYGTLEIKKGKQKQYLKLDGFLHVADFDNDFVYVFAAVVDQNRSALYVIDRRTGKKVKEIDIKVKTAQDMVIIKDDIILSSLQLEGNKIAVINKKNWQQQYISLPYTEPEFFFLHNGKIYITHEDQDKITVLDANTKKVVQTATIGQPVLKARLSDNKLYVLSQLESKKHAGFIGVYDIHTWKQEKKFFLPQIRDTLVQDLTIIP